uniref:RNA methyltransferase n=1 Tax=Chromera velia CCMP2878 TaxID=1169474 RepID=A0A0G4I216_9ALVE|eukprot:Cvel_34893.t1-p1 / transcript=Cvel_34893.t1 / gene=Cvel_34893 / organism=Chromera_velia_CCMP2878 / gene_product=Probable RNA methyltransferase Y17G7B.18, putative / transcript_product=Probable RNA methyltransferase Y17G7B.18, putative / location=Cvel_scaffold6156:864-2261(-) / protein_length=466 / sequence_SO=supercontig / SO=protein_coding / is_pseudo=false
MQTASACRTSSGKTAVDFVLHCVLENNQPVSLFLILCSFARSPLSFQLMETADGLVKGPFWDSSKNKWLSTYGNYPGYYNYRQVTDESKELDPRLRVLSSHDANFFRGKSVLDIGCNTGQIPFMLGAHLGAKRVLGVEIDVKLLTKALTTLRDLKRERREHLIESGHGDVYSFGETGKESGKGGEEHITHEEPAPFPWNINFAAENFLTSPRYDQQMDAEAQRERCQAPPPVKGVDASASASQKSKSTKRVHEEKEKDTGETGEGGGLYDVVLALSVSKWIHLHNGDDGIRAFFRKCYRVLKPGGLLVLEPQPWTSYRKARQDMTEEMRETMRNIVMHPRYFLDYLTQEMDFEVATSFDCEKAGPSEGLGKGKGKEVEGGTGEKGVDGGKEGKKEKERKEGNTKGQKKKDEADAEKKEKDLQKQKEACIRDIYVLRRPSKAVPPPTKKIRYTGPNKGGEEDEADSD